MLRGRVVVLQESEGIVPPRTAPKSSQNVGIWGLGCRRKGAHDSNPKRSDAGDNAGNLMGARHHPRIPFWIRAAGDPHVVEAPSMSFRSLHVSLSGLRWTAG